MMSVEQAALEKLLFPPSREVLLDFISWLDLQYADSSAEMLPMQILTRSIVAVGRARITNPYLITAQPMAKTLLAAEVYCLAPDREHFEIYFNAATNSYPFGSGEGCYAVTELKCPGCEPGSGCSSGAGSLYFAAIEFGVDRVWLAMTRELIPWLRGEADPIVQRKNQSRSQVD